MIHITILAQLREPGVSNAMIILSSVELKIDQRSSAFLKLGFVSYWKDLPVNTDSSNA